MERCLSGHLFAMTRGDEECPVCEANKVKNDRISELEQQLEAERAKVAKLECLYRWRPISEIHEDYGPCVCVHLIDDPCYLEIHWSNETEFDETAWTHFAQVPKLLTVDAERLIEEYRSAAALQAPELKA